MIIYKFLKNIQYFISTILSTYIFRFKLKYFRCKIGKNIKVDGKVIIRSVKYNCINIGDNFKLNSRNSSNLVGITNPASFQILQDGKIDIGHNCGFTSTVISCRKKISIGNNVKIGGNVKIFDHDYHSLNHELRRDSFLDGKNVKSLPIIIDDDVFIGTNSIILKGVNIGRNSIIGAGSVVAIKNIPPNSVVVGNPARIIN
jgi:acetyltransferase-like isoleucine patch superfamily enzyme